MRRKTLCVLLGLGVGLGAMPARAQVFTPSYMAPQLSSDLGIYLSSGPGDFAIEGVWRRTFGTYDLGFRGGLADVGGAALVLAGELRTPLGVDAPVLMSLTTAAQGIVGDASAAGFAGGLTVGYRFVPGDFSVTPYIHPRIALVSGFGRDEDLDLEVLADIGFDFEVQNLIFRIGFGLGDPTADWGIGFSWR